MELAAIALFCAILMICIVTKISVLYALLLGLAVFCGYAGLRRFSPKQILHMVLDGLKTTKNILIVFALIGMLTALWRACGTIPVIVSYAARLIHSQTVLLMTFLLNCGVSVLTGSSFGAAATMGVISMTMAVSMQVSPVLAGGAMLSGVYFGDRCSPVSTSALLVSELTSVNIFDNVRKMLRTALLPFLLTCGIYGLLGLFSGSNGTASALPFGTSFRLHPLALLPAAAIVALSLLRVPVKLTMSVSILSSFLLAIFLQGLPVTQCLRILAFGYVSPDPALSDVLDGGGIVSMLKPAVMITLSSAYAGIFRETGLLSPLKSRIAALSRVITPFGGTFFTAVITSLIACNQALTIILTHQLCEALDPENTAINLEDTAAIASPLVPWSIAGAVPLATVGAPTVSLCAACFLYLVPLWGLLRALLTARHGRTPGACADHRS